MSIRIAARGLLVLLLDALTLLLLSELLPGFVLDGAGSAIGAAALIGLLNALVWPLLARVALPLTVLTLGLAALVLNGALVTFAVDLLPGAQIDGIWEGTVVTIAMTAVTAVVYSLLAIDEDDSWYRHVVRRQLRRRKQAVRSDVPGVVFLEIDGLAHDVLHRALSDGSAPNLAAWLRDGSHRLQRWETDWSSQTGACQAGLLHGDNEDMPAFRWWEKDRGRAIVTNHPRDAEELERRHSDGRGLLHADGASRANILSGDAPHSMLTMSTALRRRRPIGRDYAAYFARPSAVARTFVLVLAEVARERRAARAQVRDDVRPRIARSRSYAFVRAWGTIVQRDLQVAAVVGDILAGRPAIYTTFLAYDEVAHHSGIERHDALAVLRDLDRQIARIAAACPEAPRPYRLVVLSDHGQSQGETFRDRYGETLEDVVRAACRPDSTVAVEGGDDDALAYLSAGLTEIARDDTAAARTVRIATRDRRADGVVALDPEARRDIEEAHGEGDGVPELSVMASGCLGLISFPREPGRVSLERIEALYPTLLPALRDHPGVGFVLVRSERAGAMAVGEHGTHFLDEGRVEGEDPLAPFGPNAADHVRRTDGFPHCADLMLNSTFWPEFGEVAAFEELVGSHGGLGGTQSFPFVLHPGELPWPEGEVVGAERVHRIFCGWLAQLGHASYASEVASPGESTRAST
ncbi:MAG TPA: phage holin family protein [Solirubrobacterales bacterium]|nr:phage holin family protein [Solirubrobacterales bacterium]